MDYYYVWKILLDIYQHSNSKKDNFFHSINQIYLDLIVNHEVYHPIYYNYKYHKINCQTSIILVLTSYNNIWYNFKLAYY